MKVSPNRQAHNFRCARRVSSLCLGVESGGACKFLSLPCAVLLGITFLASAGNLWAGKDRERDARILLIRGLDHEIAVAKVPLPAGKKGVFIDPQGEVDQKKAAAELQTNGMSIRPGMPVEITKINFHAKSIVFELNGGGKKGKKWYQRIEIGMGPGAMTPLAPQRQAQTIGSSITLRLAGNSSDLTVAHAKKLLSQVLDFNHQTPTLLYSPSVPPQFKEAIKKHEVRVGMNRDMVLSAKGPPGRKVREVKDDGEEEVDWIYGLPPHVLFVVFDGDDVVRVTQY